MDWKLLASSRLNIEQASWQMLTSCGVRITARALHATADLQGVYKQTTQINEIENKGMLQQSV